MKKSGTTLVAVIHCHQRGIFVRSSSFLVLPEVVSGDFFEFMAEEGRKAFVTTMLLRAYLSYTNTFAKTVAARLYQGFTLFSWGKLPLWNNSLNFFILMSTVPALGLLYAFLIQSIIVSFTVAQLI